MRSVGGSGMSSLTLALAIDALVAEPPRCLHPVVGMGRLVAAALPPDPEAARGTRRLRGTAVLAGAGCLAGACGAAAGVGSRRLPGPAAAAGQALAIWPLLALRGLCDAALAVRDALEAGDIAAARRGCRSLVGRPVDGLPESLLASAAVESVAENLADSVVAPLLYARLLGPGAAAAYRLVNTADAMVGYRDRFRLGGWAAARADDGLGLAPARLAALGIVVAAPLQGGSACGALRAWRRDGGRTPSPNAGRPMAAMAGALAVRLEKRGAHVLNPRGRACRPADIARAVALVRAASLIALAACAAVPAIAWPPRASSDDPRG